MTDAQLAFFRDAFRDQALAVPANTYELEVDGILSFRPRLNGVVVRALFSVLHDVHDGECWDVTCVSDGHAYLRCSQPYTPDDERRWLAGERDRDLDTWDDY